MELTARTKPCKFNSSQCWMYTIFVTVSCMCFIQFLFYENDDVFCICAFMKSSNKWKILHHVYTHLGNSGNLLFSIIYHLSFIMWCNYIKRCISHGTFYPRNPRPLFNLYLPLTYSCHWVSRCGNHVEYWQLFVGIDISWLLIF